MTPTVFKYQLNFLSPQVSEKLFCTTYARLVHAGTHKVKNLGQGQTKANLYGQGRVVYRSNGTLVFPQEIWHQPRLAGNVAKQRRQVVVIEIWKGQRSTMIKKYQLSSLTCCTRRKHICMTSWPHTVLCTDASDRTLAALVRSENHWTSRTIHRAMFPLPVCYI